MSRVKCEEDLVLVDREPRVPCSCTEDCDCGVDECVDAQQSAAAASDDDDPCLTASFQTVSDPNSIHVSNLIKVYS